MNSTFRSQGTGLLTLCVLLSACLTSVGAAQGGEANAVAYNANSPVYPVSYTEAQKNAQRDAGRAVVKEINAAIAAGAKSFTVPPCVYRLPAKGPDREIKLWKVKGFALHLANTEWALENGGGFIFPQECENISVLGPVKFDADPLCFFQGTVLAHDDNTGLTRVRIMPGYKVDLAPKFRLAAPEAAIQLQGVDKARLWDNTVIGCPGWNLAAKNANALSIKGNTFKDAYQAPGSPSKNSPSAVISLVGCTNADVEANSITGTDAANGIWVEGSANIHLAGNRAAKMSTPGAVLVGTGSNNTNLRDDDSPGNRTGGRPR